jgi:acetyltransferase-like isoleucine patch superfamily enzyme
VLRASYFISFGSIGDEISLWNMLVAITLAISGTALAPYVIERMSDHDFRQWTRAIIFTISGVYIGRAAWLAWQG